MSKTKNKFAPEVRKRAVRLILSNEGQHGSPWEAVISISAKIGCAPQTLCPWFISFAANYAIKGAALNRDRSTFYAEN